MTARRSRERGVIWRWTIRTAKGFERDHASSEPDHARRVARPVAFRGDAQRRLLGRSASLGEPEAGIQYRGLPQIRSGDRVLFDSLHRHATAMIQGNVWDVPSLLPAQDVSASRPCGRSASIWKTAESTGGSVCLIEFVSRRAPETEVRDLQRLLEARIIRGALSPSDRA